MNFNFAHPDLQGTFKGLIVTANGQLYPEEPLNGSDYELDQLKHIVEGHIEIVYLRDVSIDGLGDDLIMILNEEGKLTGLAVNQVATQIWQSVMPNGYTDWIAGNVLITTSGRVK
jgi:hypothetical protein